MGGPLKPPFGLSGFFVRLNLFFMPWGLKRFQNTGQSHFITFCCYHRRPLFIPETNRRVFELALERVRGCFDLRVFAYVVMLEHVHLLLSEPELECLADALKSLKQGVSRRLIGDAEHFWQKRYYDFNIRNHPQFVEKLHYIHNNPVMRGLCERAEDWEWSSFRHHATGVKGVVQIESEWTARKRERAEGKLCAPVQLPHSSQKTA